MRMYLSQIREWVVEFSADMLFISIRTDAAWYRLVKPAAKYAAWYQVPLKAARIAVKVISWLVEESRASRLSWADVVKRLAEQDSSSSTFISKKVSLPGVWNGCFPCCKSYAAYEAGMLVPKGVVISCNMWFCLSAVPLITSAVKLCI
jgi:hypothetical protein